MATDPFETAVIDAAVSLVQADRMAEAPPAGTPELQVHRAVAALLEHRERLGQVTEVEWSTVAEGDFVRAKTGSMWKVKNSLRMQDGTYSITLELDGKTSTVNRPSKEAPTALVRRGPAGRAVESFAHVFASGGAG